MTTFTLSEVVNTTFAFDPAMDVLALSPGYSNELLFIDGAVLEIRFGYQTNAPYVRLTGVNSGQLTTGSIRFATGYLPLFDSVGPQVLTGTSGADVFFLRNGGADQVVAGDGLDRVHVGSTLDAADRISAGNTAAPMVSDIDYLVLGGVYATAVTLDAETVQGFETFLLEPKSQVRLVLNAETVASTAAAARASTYALTVDGTWQTGADFADIDGTAAQHAIHFKGGFGADRLIGGSGADYLQGGYGNDTLYGGGGADRLAGEVGFDVLYGGDGDDVLLAGYEGDHMFGGAGADQFWARDPGGSAIFPAGTPSNFGTVRDFSRAEGDLIVLRQFVPNDERMFVWMGSVAANFTFQFGKSFGGAPLSTGFYGFYTYVSGTTTLVIGDLNANRVLDANDLVIAVAGVDAPPSMLASDFVAGFATLGTDSSETFDIGPGGVLLYAYGGADTVNGGAGVDTVYGGAGDDRLLGNGGADRLYGGDGRDHIEGGEGDDRVSDDAVGGAMIWGGGGADQLSVSRLSGMDLLTPAYVDGGEGDDRITAGAGVDVGSGGGGADVITSGAGDDRLTGDAEADRLSGDAGRDELSGDSGDDILDGGADDDRLFGGAGADELNGFLGADTLAGGADADRFVYHLNVNNAAAGQYSTLSVMDVVTDFSRADGDKLVILVDGSEPILYRGEVGATFVLSEGRTLANPFDHFGISSLWTYQVDQVSYVIFDLLSNGRLDATDLVFAVSSDVAIDPADFIAARPFAAGLSDGADVRNGTPGDDFIFALGGDDQVVADPGKDVVYGGGGIDRLFGEAGDDVLHGESGDDVLHGGSDADVLFGGFGADLLQGGDGGDQLWGDSGDDRFEGGAGVDDLHGGDGFDTADYSNATEAVHIDTPSGGLMGVTVGGVLVDRIEGIERLIGGSGADIFAGNSAAERFFGNAGDDRLSGDRGDDYLHGGSGFDTVVTSAMSVSSQSAVIPVWNGFVVLSLEGVDRWRSVERAVFFDRTVERDAADGVDDLWYLATYDDVAASGLDADEHFNGGGRAEGRNPNAFFDRAYYLQTNPDVAAAGVDPWLHFMGGGWAEGRDPSAAFSVRGYLQANLDVALSGENPLLHYLRVGMDEGRSRNVMLDEAFYLASNPDVDAALVDPYLHWLAAGRAENRDPNAWFDADGYLATYPDVAAAGIDPLSHYLNGGWLEGRDPSMRFDTGDYLAANPDVAAAGINPLLHWLAGGRLEGRAAFDDGVWG